MELNNPLLDWKGFGLWLDENKGNMSNRELARRVGLSPAQIGNILAGTSKTTTENIILLAQHIGKSQQEAFMVLGAEKPSMSKEDVEIISASRSVPPGRRAEFVQLVKAAASVYQAAGV